MNELWHAEIYTGIENEDIPLVGMTVVQGLPGQWESLEWGHSCPLTLLGANIPFWSLLPSINNYPPSAAGVSD